MYATVSSGVVARRPMGTRALLLWTVIAALAFSGFLALGQWQLQRRAWKLDLIAQVESRIHAHPVTAPTPAQWGDVVQRSQDFAYRRLQVSGVFLHAQTTLVQATTQLGMGWWVLTPLSLDDGSLVWINRGFVPLAQISGVWRTQPQGHTTVTGLLRLSEPGGTWLRKNDAQADRWFSRDVAHMAAHHGLEHVAPYFIDAEASTPVDMALFVNARQLIAQAHLPIGGLTVVSFPNNHLVYALTWLGLALMVAAAMVYVGREEVSLRRAHANPARLALRQTRV